MRGTVPKPASRQSWPIILIAFLVSFIILLVAALTGAGVGKADSLSTDKSSGKLPDVPMEGTPTPTATPTTSPIATACVYSDGGFESGTLGNYTSQVATCVPGGCGWYVTTVSPHTGLYSAFAPDVDDVSDQMLVRNGPIPAWYGGFQFYHAYNFENNGNNFYDGGIIEGSTDSGASWFDLGPNLQSGGYNGTISSCCSNPLAGRMAWVGNSGGYVYGSVNLVPFDGENLYVRFRLATDSSFAADGWHIDEVSFFGACATYTPITTNTPIATNTPIPTDTFEPTNTSPPDDTATPITDPTDTPIPSSCTIEFSDVQPDNTFYSFVRCLACQGIINGYPCGGPGEPCNENNDPYFRPGNPVTRGQLAKIVSESAGFDDPPTGQTFEDVLPGSTSYTYTERLALRNVMSGYACGGPGEPCGSGDRPYFRPNSGATRGQLSKIVANVAGFSDPAPDTNSFTDVPVGSTFHLYIERLLLNRPGVISGYPCGGPGEPCDPENRSYFRPNNGLTRGQTSKITANTFFSDCQVLKRAITK